MEFSNTCPLSIIRSSPRMTMFAACLFCSPFVLPGLLVFSPFLLLTSLFSLGCMSFVRSLLQLRDTAPEPVRKPMFVEIQRSAKATRISSQVKDARVREYLEDQLGNVRAWMSEAGEDPSPFSFSYTTETETEDGKCSEFGCM